MGKTLSELKIGRYPPAVVAYPDTTILEVLKRMAKKWVRHSPIIDEKTGKVLGMVSARDLINFLGGGPKHKIVEEKYDGDLYEALVNEHVCSIKYIPPTVSLNTKLYEVINLMMGRNIGALCVVDENDNLVGIISERHIIGLIESYHTLVKVSEIMSRPLIYLPPQANIIECQRLMHKKHIRRVALKDEGGLKGIVTIKDIVKFYSKDETLEEMRRLGKENVYNTPVYDIATKGVVCINPERDIGEAVEVMRKFNIGSLIVVNSKGENVGIITERDYILKLPKIKGVEIFVDAQLRSIVVGRVYI
ncbi:MAG: CBS domain-containing protein [Thermoproteales archaeon]|nr:CBS domain-containing protein [Thermoproteales archaeon]